MRPSSNRFEPHCLCWAMTGTLMSTSITSNKTGAFNLFGLIFLFKIKMAGTANKIKQSYSHSDMWQNFYFEMIFFYLPAPPIFSSYFNPSRIQLPTSNIRF